MAPSPTLSAALRELPSNAGVRERRLNPWMSFNPLLKTFFANYIINAVNLNEFTVLILRIITTFLRPHWAYVVKFGLKTCLFFSNSS